jgi:hypothetical protein
MAISTAQLSLYIYTGTSGSYQNSDLKYTIQKERINADDVINFEVSNLVRDYIDLTFNNDYLSKCVWVTAIANLFDENNEPFTYSNPQTNTYLALDGYGYFEDEVNPQLSTNALISSNNIYLPENTAGKLPIFAEGVGKYIIDSTTTQVTDSGNTNQKIQYITVPANSSTIQIFDTDDATLRKTITVNNVCEPKFTPYKITFVNKFGAFQDLYMFKKNIENLSVTDETFRRNIIVNNTTSYPTYAGQSARYNVNGQTTLTLNTGFIKEDMNQTIEELFLTENVWIRYENKTLPVIPKTKSLAFKTSLNDKLINYTIEFEFAFTKINSVR